MVLDGCCRLHDRYTLVPNLLKIILKYRKFCFYSMESYAQCASLILGLHSTSSSHNIKYHTAGALEGRKKWNGSSAPGGVMGPPLGVPHGGGGVRGASPWNFFKFRLQIVNSEHLPGWYELSTNRTLLCSWLLLKYCQNWSGGKKTKIKWKETIASSRTSACFYACASE